MLSDWLSNLSEPRKRVFLYGEVGQKIAAPTTLDKLFPYMLHWFRNKRTFAMLKDPLRDTPAYQRFLKEGRELERQQNLERQRQMLLEIVQVRFPKLLHLAKGLVAITTDPEVLEHLIVKMGTAQTLEEAQKHLFDVDGNERKN
jgi:hypothetical protein